MQQILAEYRARSLSALAAVDLASVEMLVMELLRTRRAGATVFIAGNGGSASTASHMATDLMLGSKLDGLRVVALSDSNSTITATGNDVSFDAVFARQLRALGRQGDTLIVITASGNSPNILEALAAADELGIRTIAMTGFSGGAAAARAGLNVHVPTSVGEYGPVEDAHLAVEHMVTRYLQDIATGRFPEPEGLE